MKGDTAKATEYFSDSKIGLNGTGATSMVQILFGADSYNALVTPAAMPKGAAGETAANISTSESVGIDINATASGSSYTYNASMFYYYLASTGYVVNWTKFSIGPNAISGTGSNPQALQALNMYELQVDLQATQQQVSFVYTNNGTTAQSTPVLKNANATLNPYLNFTKMNNASYVMNSGKASGGFLFDWMYLVDQNTISYPSVLTAGAMVPAGSFSNLKPSFDPTSAANQSAYQNANVTNTYNGVSVSNDIFSTVLNGSSTAVQNSIGLNTSQKITQLSTQFNGTQAVATTALSNTTNITVNTNEKVSTWTGQYVTDVLTNYLKIYAASQAEKELGVYVSTKDITLISYRIGSEFIDSTYTSSAASQLRTYLDNSYASLLAANNLSLVNPSSGAIVAGAAVGNFYLNGQFVHPEIQGNEIINPVTNQVFTLQSAGFSPGAYISGGAVIVPQLAIVGWTDGSPVFSAQSFSFGNPFGFLSSAGSAVSNLFQSAASTVTNGIGSVAKVVDNNVVKPLTTTTSQSISSFESGMGNIIQSAIGSVGTIGQNIQGAFSNGFAGLSSAVNSIKGTLASSASDTASAIMSGFSGIKTGISSIGASVQSGLTDASNGLSNAANSLVNTANKAVSTATAALSTEYNKMSNFVAGSVGNIYHDIKGASNATLAALDSVGNTISKTTNGFYTSALNTFGGISQNINNAVSGLKGDFSFMSGIPALISHVLLYVGIGALIVVGGLIFFFVWRARSSSKAVREIGEKNIR
jgi:hypothetical protein